MSLCCCCCYCCLSIINIKWIVIKRKADPGTWKRASERGNERKKNRKIRTKSHTHHRKGLLHRSLLALSLLRSLAHSSTQFYIQLFFVPFALVVYINFYIILYYSFLGLMFILLTALDMCVRMMMMMLLLLFSFVRAIKNSYISCVCLYFYKNHHHHQDYFLGSSLGFALTCCDSKKDISLKFGKKKEKPFKR
jgi:hypothetical protein